MTTFRIGELEITRIEDFADHGVPPAFLLPEVTAEMIAANAHWLTPNFLNLNNTIDVPSTAGSSVHDITQFSSIPVSAIKSADVSRHSTCATAHFFKRLLRRAFTRNRSITYSAPTSIAITSDGTLAWLTADGSRHSRMPLISSPARTTRRFDPRTREWRQYGGTDEETFLDSVLPVVESGQVELVNGERQVGDRISVIPCPGRSPGHSALRVEDSGDSGPFTGDAMHHPLQVVEPDLNSFTCVDADLARASRRTPARRLLRPSPTPRAGPLRSSALRLGL
jgi:hypothetical protein